MTPARNPQGPERPSDGPADRRTRALEEPLDVRPRPGTPYARFEVRNPRRKTRYLVLMPEFPERGSAFCSCEDFGRRGLGTCKHLEAVVLRLDELGEEGRAEPLPYDGGPAWKEIDRRIAEIPRDPSPDPVRYRGPGRVLIPSVRD